MGAAPKLRLVADPAGREPPNDPDAERLVLSAVLVDPVALDQVVDILDRPDMFHRKPHQVAWEAILDVSGSGGTPGLVDVASWLRARSRLDECGGVPYLTELANCVSATVQIERHARVIRDKWRLRRLAEEAWRIAAECYGPIPEPQAFLEAAELAVGEVAKIPEQTTVTSMSDPLKEVFRKSEEAAKRGQRISGISTGFRDLDQITAGLHVCEQTVIAGRPGMGKTAFAMALALNVAGTIPTAGVRQGVAFFSLEMDREQLAARTVCSEARVDSERLRTGTCQPEDWARLTQAASWLAQIPLVIDDRPGMSPLEIRAKCRRIQAEMARLPKDSAGNVTQLSLVVVDYLQLMKARAMLQNNASREQEVSACSQVLKDLSKELRVPVVALAQLNRIVASAKDKRPELQDLRESGAIEQNADTVIFIHREEYYMKEKTPNDLRGVAEIIVGKQRNGRTDTVKTRFVAQYTRFEDMDANGNT
jgi:replicative DNA helicase